VVAEEPNREQKDTTAGSPNEIAKARYSQQEQTRRVLPERHKRNNRGLPLGKSTESHEQIEIEQNILGRCGHGGMGLLLEPVATPQVEEAKREMKAVLWN
jgi:hypothetical protein